MKGVRDMMANNFYTSHPLKSFPSIRMQLSHILITSLQCEVQSWTNNAFDSCLYLRMRFFATLAINQTWTLKAKLGLNNILRVGQAL